MQAKVATKPKLKAIWGLSTKNWKTDCIGCIGFVWGSCSALDDFSRVLSTQ